MQGIAECECGARFNPNGREELAWAWDIKQFFAVSGPERMMATIFFDTYEEEEKAIAALTSAAASA